MASTAVPIPSASPKAGTTTDARTDPAGAGRGRRSCSERRTLPSSTARYSTSRTAAAAASATTLAPTSALVDVKPWAAKMPRSTATSTAAATVATATNATGMRTQRT